MTAEVKRVYAFGKDAEGNNVTEGNTNMKAILGGKGANLAEMANIGLPVPPGFTISCQTCMEYANADNTWPEGALDTIHESRLDLEKTSPSTALSSKRKTPVSPGTPTVVSSRCSLTWSWASTATCSRTPSSL